LEPANNAGTRPRIKVKINVKVNPVRPTAVQAQARGYRRGPGPRIKVKSTRPKNRDWVPGGTQSRFSRLATVAGVLRPPLLSCKQRSRKPRSTPSRSRALMGMMGKS